jgi:hypothetical protein
MLKLPLLLRFALPAAMLSLSAFLDCQSAVGAVMVHSMHRSIGGHAIASTNGVAQTNVFGEGFTNKGARVLNGQATVI